MCRSSTLENWKVSKTIPIDGDNLRQVAISPDGKMGYVANMKNRRFPTTKNNIDLGWVLGQRLTRIPLDGSANVRHALARYPGKGRQRRPRSRGQPRPEIRGRQLRRNARGHDLPDRLEPSPLAAQQLARPDRARAAQERRPLPKGGRWAAGPPSWHLPLAGNLLYVANYLSDAIQVVDAESAKLVQTIPLGGPKTLSLERKGEIVFHDASHSFNQWYSCNTCHSDGHTERPRFRHAQRRPAGPEHVPRAQPQEGSDPPPRDRDQTVDLARLADEPGRRRVRVVHQEHAGPKAQGRRRQIADCLSRHARIPQEPVSATPTAA